MDALTREPMVAPPRSRTRRWVMALLGVLVTIAIGAGIWLWPAPSPDIKASRMRDANQVIPVVEAVATKRDMPLWLDGLGTVQAFQTVTVKSMVDGPLVDVAFSEGQDVRTGDVLARIDPRIYQASLDNAVAKKALDEATLANARLDLLRYQKLVVTNYATQQQADTAKATVAQLEAQVRQDQSQIDTAQTQLSYTTIKAPLDGKIGLRLVDKGNIVHASDATGLLVITQLQPISVMFNLPQQNLEQVAAAQVAATRAAATQAAGVQMAATQAGMTQAGTTQAGTTQAGTTQAGTTQAGTTPAGTTPAATTQAATTQASGTPAPVKVPPGVEAVAYAQGAGKPLDHGALTVLDNQIDPTTGTIKLKATFPNAAGLLWPGGFVGVRLKVDTVHDATVVPQAAVQRGQNQSFVFVVDQDNVAHRQIVVIGYEDEQGSIVTSGVNPGDHVVVDGASRLTDGAKVSLVQPDAAAPPAAPNRPAAPGTRQRGQGRQTGTAQGG
jgi:multidrug efflux system membrane fusion protein